MATLFTVDTSTGAAKAVGDVVDQNGSNITLTGLEFGTDGVLYGLGRMPDQDTLFTIDPSSGSATRVGVIANVGTGSTTSLTTVPEPSSLALLAVACVTMAAIDRRRK